MEKVMPSNGQAKDSIVWLAEMEENNREAALMESEARRIEAEIRLEKARQERNSIKDTEAKVVSPKPEPPVDVKIIKDRDIVKIRAVEENDRGVKVESLEKYAREGRTNASIIARTITNGEPAWTLAQAAHTKGAEFYAVVKVGRGQIPQPHFVSFCYEDAVAGTGRKMNGLEEYEAVLRKHCELDAPKAKVHVYSELIPVSTDAATPPVSSPVARPAPTLSKFDCTRPADPFLRKGEPVARAAERFAYAVLQEIFGDGVEWTNEKGDKNHYYDLVVFENTIDVKLTEYQTEDPWMWVSLGTMRSSSRADALAKFRDADQAKYFLGVYYDKVKGEMSIIGSKKRDGYADLFEVRKVRDNRMFSTCVRRESLDRWDVFTKQISTNE